VLVRSSLALAALLLAGCTHAAEFAHEAPRDDAIAPLPSRSDVRIAVANAPGTDTRLERRVESALYFQGAGLVLPEGTGIPVEYRVELHVRHRAMTEGTNLFICWPGFLAFAPAWHGLEWPYRVNTRVDLDRADGTHVTTIERSDLYEVLYTSEAYGSGAGFGWVLASVPALVTGGVAALAAPEHQLDEKFHRLASVGWARQIAALILQAIARDRIRVASPNSWPL
jgi:hypothetical protein